MVENFHHYWRAYGGWSFVMKPYYDEGNIKLYKNFITFLTNFLGITKFLDDPLNAEAQKYFDPYFFRDRLVMPKFYISSTGDEFFLPDDSHYWLKVRNF